MLDVLVAGAGPAGAVAATILARAGARVVLLDRDPEPRHRCCDELLDPRAVHALDSLGLWGGPLRDAVSVPGIRVSAGSTVCVVDHGSGGPARAIDRFELDRWLRAEAVRAGARVEYGVTVDRPLVDDASGIVRGLIVSIRETGAVLRLPAIVTIGADGSASALAAHCGPALSSPASFSLFSAVVDGGAPPDGRCEMHLRARSYVRVMPAGTDRAQVCVWDHRNERDSIGTIVEALARYGELMDRFAGAAISHHARGVYRPASGPVKLGVPGLLLAGDAAGEPEPLAGDGLWRAIEGARLAAEVTLRTLESGDLAAAPGQLATLRRSRLGASSWQSVRRLQTLLRLPGAAFVAGRVAPGVIGRAVLGRDARVHSVMHRDR